MKTSSTSSKWKNRPKKLRASCDGCFLAKVKCCKTRPICARCLTCGMECSYSPSLRAGKPKAEINSSQQSRANLAKPQSASKDGSSTAAFTTQRISIRVENNESPITYSLDTDCSTAPRSSAKMNKHSISPKTTSMIHESSLDSPEKLAQHSTKEPYDSIIEWNSAASQANISFYGEKNVLLQRSNTPLELQLPPLIPTWFDDSQDFLIFPTHSRISHASSYSQPSNIFQPSLPFEHHPRPHTHPCTCFTVCLQSLLALHSASVSAESTSLPQFDLLISINGKAVESCASILACRNCLSASDATTTTMLIATIIDKIMSFYRSASQSSFNRNRSLMPQCGLPLNIESYRIGANGRHGRRLEMEILRTELKKFDELFKRFSEVVIVDAEGNGQRFTLIDALAGYLSQSRRYTLEILKIQEGVDQAFQA